MTKGTQVPIHSGKGTRHVRIKQVHDKKQREGQKKLEMTVVICFYAMFWWKHNSHSVGVDLAASKVRT